MFTKDKSVLRLISLNPNTTVLDLDFFEFSFKKICTKNLFNNKVIKKKVGKITDKDLGKKFIFWANVKIVKVEK